MGAKYATGDQWINNSRKNEEIEPKQKQHPDLALAAKDGEAHTVSKNKTGS